MLPIVFIGPTISPEEVAELIDADCRPPAAQGDVYLAALSLPPAIGIVDGYFSGKAAVWHKEILWALSQQIPVFGAASMGALRAAELDAFGMAGVGTIYENYASGLTEDDDEVAVVHAPAELGSAPLSEPMVNVRATLARAIEADVISTEEAADLERRAKELNYVNRTWDRIAAGAFRTTQNWLTQNRVDQKNADAREMLSAIRSAIEAGSPPPAAEFTFERTAIWERATSSWVKADLNEAEQRVLEEAHVSGTADDLHRKALLRRLALVDAYDREAEILPDAQRDAFTEFRRRHDLLSGAALSAWLNESGLTQAGLTDLLLDELFIEETASEHASLLARPAVDVLRLEGKFGDLEKRAEKKREALAGKGADGQLAGNTGLMRHELLSWFFEHQKNATTPEDLVVYCATYGIGSVDRLVEIIAAEYLYLQTGDETT